MYASPILSNIPKNDIHKSTFQVDLLSTITHNPHIFKSKKNQIFFNHFSHHFLTLNTTSSLSPSIRNKGIDDPEHSILQPAKAPRQVLFEPRFRLRLHLGPRPLGTRPYRRYQSQTNDQRQQPHLHPSLFMSSSHCRHLPRNQKKKNSDHARKNSHGRELTRAA